MKSGDGYVVVGIETTGFDPARDEIIRIDALTFGSNRSSGKRYRTLVKPTRKLTKFVPSITGIPQKQLKRSGRRLIDAWQDFIRFAEGRRLVMYNAEFGAPFLQTAAARCRTKVPRPIVCIRKLARKAWPGLERYSVRHLIRSVPAVRKRTLHVRLPCRLEAAVYEAAMAKLRLTR